VSPQDLAQALVINLFYQNELKGVTARPLLVLPGRKDNDGSTALVPLSGILLNERLSIC